MNIYTSEAICQLIPTIQCEINIGKPVILIRLKGCNCACTWCDTKYSWNPPNRELLNNENWDDYIPKLTPQDLDAVIDLQNQYPHIKSLMITGGEPLLYLNQNLFFELLNLNGFDFIEIETNGSLLSNFEFLEKICPQRCITFNISPKLNPDFYYKVSDYFNLIKNTKNLLELEYNEFDTVINYKFVYDGKNETTNEILRFINDNDLIKNVGSSHIYIMAKTPPQLCIANNSYSPSSNIVMKYKELEKKVIEFCLNFGFSFTPRVHLDLFNTKNEVLDF